MLFAMGKVALQPSLPVFGRDDVVFIVEEQEVAGHLNQCDDVSASAFRADDFRRVGRCGGLVHDAARPGDRSNPFRTRPTYRQAALPITASSNEGSGLM